MTVSQVMLLFPEIKLLCRAAKEDYDSIHKLGNRLPSSLYYCGITDDPARRASEHNAMFITSLDAGNRFRACAIEMTMEGLGFDTGRKSGNGGNEHSKYVYIYRKVKGKTIETK